MSYSSPSTASGWRILCFNIICGRGSSMVFNMLLSREAREGVTLTAHCPTADGNNKKGMGQTAHAGPGLQALEESKGKWLALDSSSSGIHRYACSWFTVS
jgi:hypothetical protein